MDEFIKSLNQDYELLQYHIKDKAVIFYIQSSKKELECPFCGSKTRGVHSVYQREIQDLPIQDKQVILLVTTRKMFCENPDCSHKTFAEKHPFAAPKAKKTDRLVKNIIHTSTHLSSLNASRLLKSENITVCKSSICSLLKKISSIVDKASVKKVCVDDFALRKRFSYGTVMVDLESHRIIDMIPSRETTDVSRWLATFANIQVISRDGASTYSSAVADSHPEAVQVSDRFHLIKGLSEAINKYIIREFPARVEIPLAEAIPDEMAALYNTANRPLRIRFAHQKRKEGLTVSDIALLLHSAPATVRKYLAVPEEGIPECRAVSRERQHQMAVQQKQREVDEARKLAQDGYPIEQISVMMHHTCKNIQNYLNPGYCVTDGHYNARIPGKLAPYEKEVIELRSKGLTYPQIHKILYEKGYTGSVASLRMFMQKERSRRREQKEQDKPQSEFIQRKSLCQLIYKKLENVATITADQYGQALKKYPLLGSLYSMVKEFHTALFSKKPEKIDTWIESAQKHNIPELQSFVEGILKDLTAIKNGIIYPYNNGLAEGSVNKIKVIKRIMYGRNSFELLKSKVLFHELFHAEFN